MTAATDPVLALFGRRVTQARRDRGWSMQDLCSEAGVASTATVWRLEHGEGASLALAFRVADALGIPIDTLTKPPVCHRCDGHPHPGFTCNACGRVGEAVLTAGRAGWPNRIAFLAPGVPSHKVTHDDSCGAPFGIVLGSFAERFPQARFEAEGVTRVAFGGHSGSMRWGRCRKPTSGLRCRATRTMVGVMTPDGEDEFGMQSCFDSNTRKPRLLSEQCATCIFRPGNPMRLRPGRLKQMVDEALREGSQGIICHATLSYGPHPNFGGALCRGFYDSVGYRNNFVRVMERLGGFTEVAPPANDDTVVDNGGE